MKKLILGLVFALAACAQGELSPREQALDLMTKYETVQVLAEIAVTSPALAEQQELKAAIKSATKVATNAVLAFDEAARACIRAADGTLTSAPGRICQPETVRMLHSAAISALTTLQAELAKHGVQ